MRSDVTVIDPPAIYDASYTIGALNTGTDTIASFSSRGPVTSDGSMRLKPDLCAPGTNTRSAYNTSDSTSRAATELPINPAAPVTRIRIAFPPELGRMGMAKGSRYGKAAARLARRCPSTG